MNSTCAAVTEEEYLDIAETLRRVEKELEDGMKEYQLYCFSSYLKFVSIANVLLALFL